MNDAPPLSTAPRVQRVDRAEQLLCRQVRCRVRVSHMRELTSPRPSPRIRIQLRLHHITQIAVRNLRMQTTSHDDVDELALLRRSLSAGGGGGNGVDESTTARGNHDRDIHMAFLPRSATLPPSAPKRHQQDRSGNEYETAVRPPAVMHDLADAFVTLADVHRLEGMAVSDARQTASDGT